MKKIFNLLIHPKRLVMSLLSHYGSFINDKTYLKLIYFIKFGRKLNLKNPTRHCDKLQWYKLYYHNPLMTKCVDKYEVTNYVKEKIGEKYLIPTLGIWDNFDDIDFDKLPNQFCLKCTHDSGSYIICKDKSTFDIDAARKKFNRYMKGRFFWYGREWAYKNVKPRIMAQEYIDSLGKPESVEYKLTCFNGKVKFITVCSGIAHSDYELRKNDHFDRDWNKLDWYAYYKPSGKVIERPEFMDEIIDISDKLAEGFPQVRIDSYVINGKVYFGEMTFYTWSGLIEFTPDEWDEKIGSWWNLPEIM